MRKKNRVLIAVCLILLLNMSITVAASPLLQEIRAYLNKEIKLTIDGAPWQARSGGNIMYPITYNGSTYLPVRAVAEALDIPIQWDEATKTVHIGGTSEHVPISGEAIFPMSAILTNDEHDRKYKGTDYGKVLWFSKILNSPSQAMIEPAGQYSKLVLKIGIEGDETRIALENTADSSVIKSVLLTEADGIVEIEANIIGIQKIRLVVKAEEPNTKSVVKILTDGSYYTTN